MFATFPLPRPPICLDTRCSRRCIREITQSNKNGNKDRPFYTCKEHPPRKFSCFDDNIGVTAKNPTCPCGYYSRLTSRPYGDDFYSCPVGACGWTQTAYGEIADDEWLGAGTYSLASVSTTEVAMSHPPLPLLQIANGSYGMRASAQQETLPRTLPPPVSEGRTRGEHSPSSSTASTHHSLLSDHSDFQTYSEQSRPPTPSSVHNHPPLDYSDDERYGGFQVAGSYREHSRPPSEVSAEAEAESYWEHQSQSRDTNTLSRPLSEASISSPIPSPTIDQEAEAYEHYPTPASESSMHAPSTPEYEYGREDIHARQRNSTRHQSGRSVISQPESAAATPAPRRGVPGADSIPSPIPQTHPATISSPPPLNQAHHHPSQPLSPTSTSTSTSTSIYPHPATDVQANRLDSNRATHPPATPYTMEKTLPTSSTRSMTYDSRDLPPRRRCCACLVM